LGVFGMVATTMTPARRRVRSSFYVWMASAFALIAFGGFAETYWLQLPAGTFVGGPLIHLHGLLFSAWTLLLLSQTALAARGRLTHHRAWGLAGIALASAMVLIGLAVATNGMISRIEAGDAALGKAFAIVPMSSVLMFAGFFAAAIANLRHPEAHKRLMLLATLSLLAAALARVFFVVITGGGPGMRPGLGPVHPASIALAPSLLLMLFVVAGIVHDWRTRGRPHPAWIAGGAIMLAVIVLRAPFSTTPAWTAVADFMAGFAR
jgi:hypothetical protein